jgi:hypothetical protein
MIFLVVFYLKPPGAGTDMQAADRIGLTLFPNLVRLDRYAIFHPWQSLIPGRCTHTRFLTFNASSARRALAPSPVFPIPTLPRLCCLPSDYLLLSSFSTPCWWTPSGYVGGRTRKGVAKEVKSLLDTA